MIPDATPHGPSGGATPGLVAFVEGVGLWTPRWTSWEAALAQWNTPATPGEPRPQDPPPPLPLAPNERRRLSPTVKLALQVAFAATANAARPPAVLGAVFACGGGNAEALERVVTALNAPGRPVSPNQFNNSVHNAALGYWSIAAGSTAPATSLAAHRASAAAGLLEAAALAHAEGGPVLLVVYDVPLPPLFGPRVPRGEAFAFGLVLSPTPAHPTTHHRLLLAWPGCGRPSPAIAPGDGALMAHNPAARGLPLLRAMASETAATVVLPGAGDIPLAVEVQPWPP
ncbi:MAG: beta-ketoacyl synthase chain length factor [Candidatus Competibacterales bacterium]